MGKLPAIQFYPGDWLKDVGVQSLNYHDRGVWFEMLCLMHESPIRGRLTLGGKAMSDEILASLLHLDIETLRVTVTTLLQRGITERDSKGSLINRRMIRDEEGRAKNRQKLYGWRKAKKLKENCNQDVTDSVTSMLPLSSSSSSSSLKYKYSMRGSRIPEDFSPSEDHAELARKMGVDLALEFEKFKDFWKAKAGKDATKLDWPATLRNWIRNAKPPGGSNGTNQPSPAKQRLDRNRQALAEAAIRRGWYRPYGNPRESTAAVADAGQRGVNRGIPDRPGATEPEILPPKGGSGT